MSNVFAIILRFNSNINQIRKQFISVIEQVNSVIYIDNASYENKKFKKFLRKQNQHYKIFSVFNSENKGLGYAQNQGIKIAFNNGASHVLLLDHDSFLEKDFVKQLLSSEKTFLENGVKIGITGPIFINSETKKQYPLILTDGFKIKKFTNEKEHNFVSYTISSGSLIRKEVFEEVGLMNEDLFIDFVDNELCWRAKFFGYKILISSRAKMNHLIGDRKITFFGVILSSHPPFRLYYTLRNSILSFRIKHIPLKSSIRTFIFQLLKITFLLIIGPNRIKYLHFGGRGFIDGIKNIKGKYRVTKI